MIEGDGIGPEVTRQAIRVLDAIAGFKHEFTIYPQPDGASPSTKPVRPFRMKPLKAASPATLILFGAIGHPKYDNDPTAKVRPERVC